MQLNDVFGADGLLKQKFPQYKPRESQVKMSELVEQAIATRKNAVIEGATGVGKGFAYLIPAIISGKKFTVSTSNKALQDQLDKHDLPTLQDVFGRPIVWAVLKGKNNYFCTEHFETNKEELQTELLADGRSLSEADLLIQNIGKWSEGEEIGDLEYLPFEVTPKVRELISCDNSTSHEKGSEAAQACFASLARIRAREADIVLVNHTLLAIEVALRLESDGKIGILPKNEYIIIDEAHKFKDAAMLAFSDDISMGSLYHLLKWNIVKKAFPKANAQALQNTLQSVLMQYLPEKGVRYYQQKKAPRFEGLEPVIEGIASLITRLNVASQNQDEKAKKKIEEIIKEAEHLQERLGKMGKADANMLRWSEAYDNRRTGQPVVKLMSTPLDIAPMLRAGLFETKTVICTSATLSTYGTFNFFKEQSGMPDNTLELIVPSPFNYKEQCLVYISDGTVDKIKETEELIKYSEGRAFVLCTSYADLDTSYNYVQTEYPKFRQGQPGMTNAQVLDAFKSTPNSVLFATASFWEGVDIQGEQLSLVILYKVPFTNPRDLVFSSQCEAIDKKAGKRGASFIKLAIPDACLKLKQGAGRLIRSATDTGVVALLDARVNSARYRDMIIDALPPSYRTQQLAKVKDFYAKLKTPKE